MCRDNDRDNYRMSTLTEVEVDPDKDITHINHSREYDSSSSKSISSSSSRSRSRSSSRFSTIEDRVRCDNDHFTKDCPNSEESEIDQLQKLYDLYENLLASQILTVDSHEKLNSINAQDTIDHLNI